MPRLSVGRVDGCRSAFAVFDANGLHWQFSAIMDVRKITENVQRLGAAGHALSMNDSGRPSA